MLSGLIGCRSISITSRMRSYVLGITSIFFCFGKAIHFITVIRNSYLLISYTIVKFDCCVLFLADIFVPFFGVKLDELLHEIVARLIIVNDDFDSSGC